MKGLIIGGPTGVGKTSISIKLAKKLNAEIISADSAQVFKGLDIGTAKIMPDEMENIKHHLIDILEPIKKYSVGNFQKDADKILNEFEQKNIFPIIVGGTGLYLDSVAKGLSDLPPANEKIRATFVEKTTEELFAELLKLDPEACIEINQNNRVRIERALEVCLLTGNKFSVLSKQNIKNNNFDFVKIVLERSREVLYERINLRVDLMMKAGLLEEVTNLYKKYGENLEKINIIGYSEIIKYLKNEISLEEAIEKIKQNSRHYAKRQFTWFKNDSSYYWYNLDLISEDEIVSDILQKLTLDK